MFEIYRTIVLVLCMLTALAAVLPAAAFARNQGALKQRRVLKGKAVYYSNYYKGHKMACGGRYRPRRMIAAHRTLPCGTKLRVKNRANGRVVRVRVRDRGPYGDRRTILDLSRRAARRLGYLRAGRTRVRAVVVRS